MQLSEVTSVKDAVSWLWKHKENVVKLKAFTLIELLVVVAIITLLISILLPSLSRARESAKSVQCRSNLHSIAQAIRNYINENNSFYPPMAIFPSYEKTLHPTSPRPPMSVVLGPYLGDLQASETSRNTVFACPSDRIIDLGSKQNETYKDAENVTDLGVPQHGETTWFAWQGSSYEPLPGFSLVDAQGRWRLNQESAEKAQGVDLTKIFGTIDHIPIMYDYEQFHGRVDATSGPTEGRMVLFADFHVDAGR
jgi:prepilin-type N-terminal cleavage/methylation domain-containing protein